MIIKGFVAVDLLYFLVVLGLLNGIFKIFAINDIIKCGHILTWVGLEVVISLLICIIIILN